MTIVDWANAAKIISVCQESITILSESDHSVDSSPSKMNAVMQDLIEHDPNLKDIADAIKSTQIQVDKAVHSLNRYL